MLELVPASLSDGWRQYRGGILIDTSNSCLPDSSLSTTLYSVIFEAKLVNFQEKAEAGERVRSRRVHSDLLLVPIAATAWALHG